jgi:two-component system sensor histidine kinase UhpB
LADLITAWQIKIRSGPRIDFDADASTDAVADDESALCIYRVVQECLNNIGYHAPRSSSACVRIRQELQSLCLRVSNDLEETRIDGGATGAGTGMGLQLLGERVRALGGSFSVEVSAAAFTVRAQLPAVVR